MSDLKRVVGIRETKSAKTGKSWYVYHLMEEFTDYEKEHSEYCAGGKVCVEETALKFDVNVGDKVKCYYDKGYQGQASIAEMIVKEKAKGSAGSAN